MPKTRRQVIIEIISFGMFDDYYSMIPGASSAIKIFAKIGPG